MRPGGGGAGSPEQGAARPSGSRMVEDEVSPEAQMGWWREPVHAWLQADAPPAPWDHWRFPPPPHVRHLHHALLLINSRQLLAPSGWLPAGVDFEHALPDILAQLSQDVVMHEDADVPCSSLHTRLV